MLVLHAADLHIDSPLVGLEAYEGCPREALRGATRRAFEGLVSVALEEQASLVLLAGDLYDGAWRDYSTGLFFVGQMRRLREAGVPVVLLRGNHDAESQITKHLKLPDNVRELSTRAPETIELEDIQVAVHGQGFATRDVRVDLAERYPRAIAGAFNVGMLHTALQGREGHETYAPTSLGVLAGRGYDYWALGHVHRSEIVSRAPWVVYPGNLQGRHVRETGAKGCVLVSVEDGRVTSVEERHVDVVRWADIVVEAPAEGTSELFERVETALARAVREAEGRLVAARVTLAGIAGSQLDLVRGEEATAAEIRAIALDVSAEGLWIGDVRTRTHTALDLAALEGSTDPIALLSGAAERAATDPELARELSAALSDLSQKLPEELRRDPSFAFLSDPAAMKDVVEDVRDVLLGALLAVREEEKKPPKRGAGSESERSPSGPGSSAR